MTKDTELLHGWLTCPTCGAPALVLRDVRGVACRCGGHPASATLTVSCRACQGVARVTFCASMSPAWQTEAPAWQGPGVAIFAQRGNDDPAVDLAEDVSPARVLHLATTEDRARWSALDTDHRAQCLQNAHVLAEKLAGGLRELSAADTQVLWDYAAVRARTIYEDAGDSALYGQAGLKQRHITDLNARLRALVRANPHVAQALAGGDLAKDGEEG